MAPVTMEPDHGSPVSGSAIWVGSGRVTGQKSWPGWPGSVYRQCYFSYENLFSSTSSL